MSTPAIDAELTTEVRSILEEHHKGAKDLFATKQELTAALREFQQKNAKPPFALMAPEASGRRNMAGLAANAEFKSWLGSPRSQRSNFVAEFPFKIETKAIISGIGLKQPHAGIAGPPQPALRLAELMPHIQISSGGGVEWTQETAFTPGADIVPETTLKPSTTLTFVPVTTPFQTVATITKASLQSLADTPQLQDWIDVRLSYAVLLRQEQYLLNGPTGGLIANAVALDAAFAPGTGATQLDFIGAAIGQLEAAGFAVDGVVMNGLDVNKTRLLKTTEGTYLWGSPDTALGTKTIWSVPLVISPSLAAGTFLVGAFEQSTILFDREMLRVDIAFENEDDFVKNLCTVRAELRAALAIPVPAGLVKGTFVATP